MKSASEAVIPVHQIILATCAKFCIDQEKAVENFLNYDLLNVFILNAPLVWSVAQSRTYYNLSLSNDLSNTYYYVVCIKEAAVLRQET